MTKKTSFPLFFNSIYVKMLNYLMPSFLRIALGIAFL